MIDEYKDRLNRSFLLYQARQGGRVSQEELAKRVGKRAKRPYTQSAAKGWLVDGVVPSDLESQLALAQELEVDPGWLYFYPFSQAPAPPGADFIAQTKKTRGKLAVDLKGERKA